MRIRFTLAVLLLWTLPLSYQTATAASPDALGIGLKALVKGKERPAITVSPQSAVKKLSIELRRADGNSQTLKARRIKAGKMKVLPFKQPIGRHTYTATFKVMWADGSPSSEFTTTFEATRVGELKLSIDAGDVDMEERRLRFRVTNPAAKAELVLLGARGKRLDLVEVEFENAAVGEALSITWDAPAGGEELLALDLKVTDVAGFWTGMRITPFSIEIPHEEVEFESGKAIIRAAESPKLEKTLTLIQKALADHGTLLSLKLFVAGYTDTVGGSASNQALSDRRARAIAAWYRKSGVKVPIYYRGFGEEVLVEETPDNTPSAANRRALYVLSSQQPTGSQFPGGGWRRL